MPTLFDDHEEFNEWFSKDIESHAENKSHIDKSTILFLIRIINRQINKQSSVLGKPLFVAQLFMLDLFIYQ